MKNVVTVWQWVVKFCIWMSIVLFMMSFDIEANALGWICYTIGAAFIGAGGTWYISKGYDNLIEQIEQFFEEKPEKNIQKRRKQTR